MRKSKMYGLLFFIIGVIGLVVFLAKFKRSEQIRENLNPTEADFRVIATAVSAYRLEFGSYPSGEAKDIAAVLMGRNAKQITFIGPDVSFVRDGVLSDVWRSPFEISSSDIEGITVKSSGPNRIWHDDDDQVYHKKPAASK